MTAKDIVLSEAYVRVVDVLKSKINIRVIEEYRDSFAKFDEKSVALSGLEYLEIIATIESDEGGLLGYSVKKHNALHGVPEEQDYAAGEQPEEHDRDVILSSKGYAPGFLLLNIIEFTLAKRGAAELEAYLKASRIPGAKAYAKQILGFCNG